MSGSASVEVLGTGIVWMREAFRLPSSAAGWFLELSEVLRSN